VNGDATGELRASEEALSRALAAAHDELAAKIALLEAEQAAGTLTSHQAAAQARAAQAVYDRDCALARITAETGWQTWTGVGGILYARLPKSSPPQVVRAPSARALRAAIEARQSN
jgi:hypothetical protein